MKLWTISKLEMPTAPSKIVAMTNFFYQFRKTPLKEHLEKREAYINTIASPLNSRKPRWIKLKPVKNIDPGFGSQRETVPLRIKV